MLIRAPKGVWVTIMFKKTLLIYTGLALSFFSSLQGNATLRELKDDPHFNEQVMTALKNQSYSFQYPISGKLRKIFINYNRSFYFQMQQYSDQFFEKLEKDSIMSFTDEKEDHDNWIGQYVITDSASKKQFFTFELTVLDDEPLNEDTRLLYWNSERNEYKLDLRLKLIQLLRQYQIKPGFSFLNTRTIQEKINLFRNHYSGTAWADIPDFVLVDLIELNHL